MATAKAPARAARPKRKPSRTSTTTTTSSSPAVLRHGKVARWGNSLAFRIPQDVAEKLKLTEGERVSLEIGTGSLTVRPVRKKWTEAELLKGVTPEMLGGEIDWGGPVGKEV